MNKCLNCGYEVPDEAKFCMYCGSSIDISNTTTVFSDLAVVEKLYELEQQNHDDSVQLFDIIRQVYSDPEPTFDVTVITEYLPYPKIDPKPSTPAWVAIMLGVCICIPIYGWLVGLLLLGFYIIPEKQRQRKELYEKE